MKKIIYLHLLSFLIVNLLSGCDSDKSEDIDISEKNNIVFNPHINEIVKAVDTDVSMLKNGFLVYSNEISSDTSSTLYLDSIIFKQNGTYWTSSPQYGWTEKTFDFYGYYPVTIYVPDTSAPETFTYTVPLNSDDEVDVVMAYAGAQTYNNTPVEMVSHHALSKVNFIFIIKGESNLNLTINSVSIVSIPTKADFTFNISATDVPDYFTVSNQNIDTTVINTLAQPVSLKAADSDVTSSSIEGLYLIPHKLNLWSYSTETTWPMQGSYINIDGEITGVTTYTGNIAIPIPTDCTEWQPDRKSVV